MPAAYKDCHNSQTCETAAIIPLINVEISPVFRQMVRRKINGFLQKHFLISYVETDICSQYITHTLV